MISMQDASTCSGALLPHFDLGSPARTQVNPSCLSSLVQAFQLLGLQPSDVSTDILILMHSAPLHACAQLHSSIRSLHSVKSPVVPARKHSLPELQETLQPSISHVAGRFITHRHGCF